MHRRDALRGLSAAGAAVTVGAAQGGVHAQSSDGAEAESYEALDSSQFPNGVSVAWIAERFIQVRNENAPIVGHDIQTSAAVIERIRTVEEYDVLQSEFDWSNFDYTESGAFSELFSAVGWPLDGSVSGEFFDTHDLLWISGVDQNYYRDEIKQGGVAVSTDQDFYMLYGHTPILFGAVEASESPNPGTVVNLDGIVRYAKNASGPITSGEGGYLDIKTVDERRQLRTPDQQWGERQVASFTGIQQHPRPQLSTSVTTVEYTDDLSRPKGGSLLAKRGEIRAAGRPGQRTVTEHRLASDDHEMLVGDFLPTTWEDDIDRGAVNISVIIDTSGSMETRDTGWYHGDGTEKMRLEVAQESTNMFLDFLQDEYTVSVVEFDTSARVVYSAVSLTDSTRETLKNNVNRLTHGGDTSIGGGLEVGHETIRNESGRKALLLLSDGKENSSPRVASVLPELRNRGIRVYTMGMGDDIDEPQLERVAGQTGGDSLTHHNPGQVRDFFRTFAIDAPGRSRHTETTAVVDEGDTVADSCRVDASCEDVQFAMSYEGSEMSLVVTDPSGKEITEGRGVNRREGAAHEVWSVDDPPRGEWNYQIEVQQVDDPQRTQAQVSSSSPITTDLFVADDLYEQTGFVRFQLKVEDELQRYTGANAHLEVRPPGEDADTEQLRLYDGGGGADDVAGDGIYSNYYHPTATGEYEFTAVVEGGEFPNLQRESEHTKRIETVVDDPIRPYELRQTDQSAGSLLSSPLLIGGGIAGAAAAAYYYFTDSSGTGAGESAPQHDRGQSQSYPHRSGPGNPPEEYHNRPDQSPPPGPRREGDHQSRDSKNE